MEIKKISLEARLLWKVPGIVHISPGEDGITRIGNGVDVIDVAIDEITGMDDDRAFDYIVEKWNDRNDPNKTAPDVCPDCDEIRTFCECEQ